MSVDPAGLIFLTFLWGVFTVVAFYSILRDFYLRDRELISQRVDEEFRKRQVDKARQSALFKNLGELAAQTAARPGDVTWPALVRGRLHTTIEQAGLDLTPERLLVIAAGAGLALGIIAGLLRQSLLTGAVAGLAGAAAPILHVRRLQRVRMRRLLAQLPDAFDLMARVIRGGQTMAQAFQAVADEFDPPLAREAGLCQEQQNLGLPPEIALRDLARRTGLLEVKIFVLAVVVQQQTGGNLAELLEKLAGVVRDRFRLQGKIRALTAEGKLQAAVLLALPPSMLVLILLLNRGYGQVLLDRPVLLAATFGMELVGWLWIRKIVNFDY
jgi:tight adherence protein B